MCEHPNCTQRPSFNILGENTPRFCNQHRTPEMVNNLKIHTCKHHDCNKIPNYMFKSGSLPLYCIEHKLVNMIRIQPIVV